MITPKEVLKLILERQKGLVYLNDHNSGHLRGLLGQAADSIGNAFTRYDFKFQEDHEMLEHALDAAATLVHCLQVHGHKLK